MSRILYIEPLGANGGMGGYNHGLITALIRRGHSVSLRCADISRVPPNVQFHKSFTFSFDRSRPRIIRALGYLCSLMRVIPAALRNDLVLWHFPHLPLLDWLAIRLLTKMRVRVVMVVHDPTPQTNLATSSFYPRAVKACQTLVVHGEASRLTLESSFDCEANAIVVASHGDFQPDEGFPHEEARGILGIPNSGGRLVASIIGNLKPGKGTERVLDCLTELHEAGIELLIAGSPVSNPRLEERLSAANIDAAPSFTGVLRRLTVTEEAAAYCASDVILAVYESGFSSGVIATAHAYKRPVVLTDVGDLKWQAAVGDAVLRANWQPAELINAIRLATSEPPKSSSQENDETWLEPWLRLANAIEHESL